MKKRLLNIAISGVLTAPLAVPAEELNIYGSVGAAVEMLDNGTTSTSEVSNNHSVLGLKGSVKVNDQVSAVFLYDMFLGIDDSTSENTNNLLGGGRDGYVGLQSDDWGTVALGFHGRPWKTSTNHLDLFGSTIADYSAIMGSTADASTYFDGGIGNGVIWFGPKINNISWQLQWGADENDDESNDWGAQANYDSGALYISASFDEDGRVGGANVSAMKLAASYETVSKARVTAMIEDIDDSALNSRQAWYIGAAYPASEKTSIKAAWSQADDLDTVNNSGATYTAVGVTHMLNKNLEIFGLVARVDNDTNASYAFVSSPHTSSNGNTAVANGEASDVFAVGLRYNFDAALIK